MSRVLVAPDKFKGSLAAVDVASAVRRGILAQAPDADVRCVPVADGGDGTVDAALAAGFERVGVTATGPTGEPVRTAFAARAATAVVEMADVSGLVRLPRGASAPLTATSRGTGEVVAKALDHGVTRIVLGIGGSASTDGGAGLLQALGASLRDRDGEELRPGGGALGELVEIDLTGLDPRLRGVGSWSPATWTTPSQDDRRRGGLRPAEGGDRAGCHRPRREPGPAGRLRRSAHWRGPP